MRLQEHLTYRALNTGTQLLCGILLARHLAPEGLGQLTLVQLFCTLITPLTQFSTKGNLLAHLEKTTTLQQISTSNTLTLLSSSLGFMLLAPTAFFAWEHSPTLALLCFGLSCFGDALSQKASSILLLKTQLKKALQTSQQLILLSCSLKILCALTLPPQTLIPCLFGCDFLAKLLQHRIQRSLLPPLPPTNQKSLKALALESLTALPQQILGQISKTLGLILLPLYASTSALGIYSVALKNGALFAIANQVLYERHLNNQCPKIAFRYASVATLLSFLTLPLLPILYGPAFQEALLWAALLIPSQVFETLNAGQLQQLYQEKKHREITTTSTTCQITGLTLTLFLIPLLGPLGLILANSSQQLLQWGLQYKCLHKHNKIPSSS